MSTRLYNCSVEQGNHSPITTTAAAAEKKSNPTVGQHEKSQAVPKCTNTLKSRERIVHCVTFGVNTKSSLRRTPNSTGIVLSQDINTLPAKRFIGI